MNIRKWPVGIVLSTFLLNGFVGSQQPAEPMKPNANLLVSGKLIRVDEPYSYKGKAAFTEDAHAVVRLYYVPGVDFGGPSEVSVVQRIEGVKGFPIHYRLEGDPEKVFRFPAHSQRSCLVLPHMNNKRWRGSFQEGAPILGRALTS